MDRSLPSLDERSTSGSCLTSKDRINDIDLCVSLVVKEKDKQDRLREQRTEAALRRGKAFKSLSEFAQRAIAGFTIG